jgi:arginyl-tRNA synthetase
MNNITASLASLGVTDLAMIPSAHPDQNPLDIFRTDIAERLAPLAGVTLEAVFSGLDRSTKPETGDFVLAIPRLRIKGAKPQELGEKWQAQVILFPLSIIV